MHGCIKKKGNSCMIIKNNLSSYNSNRQLGIVVKRQAKSSEKLSSVYKINRAADDAELLFSQQPALRCWLRKKVIQVAILPIAKRFNCKIA